MDSNKHRLPKWKRLEREGQKSFYFVFSSDYGREVKISLPKLKFLGDREDEAA